MLKIPRVLGVLVALGALLLGSGCTPGAGESVRAGQVRVVAAFYPLQFLAERLAGPHAAVVTLTQPGTEPHDLELTPRQVGAISTADLVVYEKGFQAAVDEAVGNARADRVVDVTTMVTLRTVSPDAEHEHEHEHEGGEGEGGHEHGEVDPHIWLDPTAMVTMAEGITARLREIDPEHVADYEANLAALRADLTALDQEFSTGLQRCERREFITSHAAFGYLAERYRLTQIGISGLSPDAEPSPARIARIHTEARDHGITTIFYETLVSPAVARAVAGDLGLRTDVLDPLEGITADSRGQDYLAVMRSNLAALRTANGCP